ncbi:MAG: hypothetical protein H6Q43_1083, partial [Deltaproteobacteria bacterium]|nr:hypothetical protein [Deltaproteobacteria bacterium]
MVIPALQDTKTPPLAVFLRVVFYQTADFPVIFRFQKPAPIIHVAIKSGRNGEDIVFADSIETLLNTVDIFLPISARRREILDFGESLKGIFRAIAEVEIKIEDQGVFHLFFLQKFFDSDGYIVEETKSPTGVGAGVMSRRTNKAEGRFALPGDLGGKDRTPHREKGDLVRVARAFDSFDLI